MQCVLCKYRYPEVNKFINTTYVQIIKNCDEKNVYHILYEALERRRSALQNQDMHCPYVSVDDIETHFTEHQLLLAHVLKTEANNIRKLQSELMQKFMNNKDISLYMKLSTKLLALVTKLHKIKSVPLVDSKPYMFD
jgi:hypothetical protein